jgi:hypothetical protein
MLLFLLHIYIQLRAADIGEGDCRGAPMNKVEEEVVKK